MRFSFLFKCGAGLLPANHCGLSPPGTWHALPGRLPRQFSDSVMSGSFFWFLQQMNAILQWQNDQGAIPHPGQCQTSVGVDIQNPTMRRAPRVTWERKSAIGSPSPNPLLIFIA